MRVSRKGTCAIDGCGSKIRARGLCVTHYESARKYGDPISGTREGYKKLKSTFSAEYRAWKMMKDRCNRKTASSYPNYGGRGISVCERWAEDFRKFLSDMGPKPSPSHSIDRIDNDGDYEPGNCRWATRQQQMNNRSDTRHVVLNGERVTITEASRRLGQDRGYICRRLASDGITILPIDRMRAGRNPLTTRQKTEIYRLLANGQSKAALQRRYGISDRYLTEILSTQPECNKRPLRRKSEENADG